jgi:hypothetical protein
LTVLLEEIRAARDKMGKYTRKTSPEYEDPNIVKTNEYKAALIKLMQEVIHHFDHFETVVKNIFVSYFPLSSTYLNVSRFRPT